MEQGMSPLNITTTCDMDGRSLSSYLMHCFAITLEKLPMPYMFHHVDD
jgi:hypothetical protein